MNAKKVAVTAEGDNLDARVDLRFGRAEYFIIYDLENDRWEAVPNRAAYEARGAGIAAATFLVEKGVDTVITGHCGPKAFSVLKAAGVKIASFPGGTVAEAIAQLKEGKLPLIEMPNVDTHFGGGMPGMGRIVGGGMGRGCGGGRGMGGGGMGGGGRGCGGGMGGGGRGMGGGGRGMGGGGRGMGGGGRGMGGGRGGW